MSSKDTFVKISGRDGEKRIPSRVLEEMIHQHIKDGHRKLEIDGFGQHGIGGRLWDAGADPVEIRITGQSGQRTGSLGNANTRIEIFGPASDDIGWLNAGAHIIVHGHVSNGAMNGGAQGKVYVAGSIGARGMTMTKRNPRFEPPELWVLGKAGDYFGEFMAGGVAVICAHDVDPADEILGHRPLVGMVGGKVFVRAEIDTFSKKDAKVTPITDEEWEWFKTNLKEYLECIDKSKLFKKLSQRSQWQLIKAKSPHEKTEGPEMVSMSWFREHTWDRELGKGGLVGDLMEVERQTVPIITKGDLRRYIPVWENQKYIAPCQAACPTGIPVQERWKMVRLDNIDEAISMGLEYTPFPATVCGYLCPSPCMASCTRNSNSMTPINIRLLGQAGENVKIPKPEKKHDKKIAVIGAGPGGISAAWHLSLKGYETTLYDQKKKLGGKISSLIPGSRIPEKTLNTELDRIKKVISDIKLGQNIDKKTFKKIKEKYDYVIIAAGAQKPRSLPIDGIEKALLGNDFLEKSKKDKVSPGRNVVIIGAGNVGCDIATEAHRLGAENITMIDVQKPAAFGKEREEAEAVGAKFMWPCFTKKITDKGVELQDGKALPADTVIISIGDSPVLDFIDESIDVENGFISVDRFNQSSDKKVFAIGDVTGPGLITDAIGEGKRTAFNIDAMIQGQVFHIDILPQIDKNRVSLSYYDPRVSADTIAECGEDCASCGQCKDCGICIAVCPEEAISRTGGLKEDFEYVVNANKCIGCGFCKGACPCGIWDLIPNTPM